METTQTHPTLPKARILVVDDEVRVREGLCWSLRVTGYEVHGASSGAEALALLGRGAFDLVLLDMKMPAMDGVEVMAHARRLQPDLAIVVLTGHATLDSAIAAVKGGASDYLLKPVAMQGLLNSVGSALTARANRLRQERVVELVSQVADVLHPPERAASGPVEAQDTSIVMRVGALSLDVAKRTAAVDGPHARIAELTEGETAILQELMRHPGQVSTCRQIVQAAWGYGPSEAEAASIVRSHIFRLRKKIEAESGNPQLIKTVRGSGYFLART